MRYLILILSILSPLAYSQVNIVPPTLYDNGQPLAAADIASFEICVSNVEEDVCASTITVPGTATAVEGIPADTKSIKGLTIDVYGKRGDYGPRFYDAFRGPLAPGFTYSITLIVGP